MRLTLPELRGSSSPRPKRNSLQIAGRLVLAAGLVAAACQHVPPAPLDPAGNARKLDSRSLDEPAVVAALARFGETMPGNGRWSLDQLTIAAWTLRPDVAVARAELNVARAGTVFAGQRLNPTLSGTAERVTNDGNDPSPWVLGAALNLTIETAGKRDIRRNRAREQEQALALRAGEQLWTARVQVRNAVIGLELAAQAVALDEEELRVRSAFREWVDLRLQRGAATRQEQLAASGAWADAGARIGLAEAERAAAANALAHAVGVAPGTMATIIPVVPDLEQLGPINGADVSAARAIAVVSRLDIRSALADYAVAEQDLRAAVASQYPDIGISPGYLYDQGARKITLSLDLPVALFHGGGAKIDGAIAKRKLAAARFDEIQSRALADIDTRFAHYHAALATLNELRQGERAAADYAAATRRRMDAGAADRGETLAAELAFVERRRDTAAARRAVIEAGCALEDAVQRPMIFPSTLELVAAIPVGLQEPAQ